MSEPYRPSFPLWFVLALVSVIATGGLVSGLLALYYSQQPAEPAPVYHVIEIGTDDPDLLTAKLALGDFVIENRNLVRLIGNYAKLFDLQQNALVGLIKGAEENQAIGGGRE